MASLIRWSADHSILPNVETLKLLEQLGNKTRALLFFQSNRNYYRVVVENQRASISMIEATVGDVDRLVDQRLDGLFRRQADLGQRLDQLLLSGLDDFLASPAKDQGALLIVPDGALHRLPFAALVAGGSFLVELTPLVTTPSLSTWLSLKERSGGLDSGPVVLGDPGTDLPRAREEARFVAKKLGVAATLGDSVNSGAFRRAKEASVLHLAMHSAVDAAGAYFELSDGKLRPGDVLRLAPAPQLAVLASCASGRESGKGVWSSLAASFLTAGSRSVVSALFSVDDERTSELIQSFYVHLQDGPDGSSLSQALARAQREAIGKGWAPADWAPFAVLGADSRWRSLGPLRGTES